MNRPRHIQRDGYHALDWQDDSKLFIDDLWRRFPELVIGHYLVNTSYDSGSLTLGDVERHDGWHMVGRLAHSPKIRNTGQIPHDQFDEWLVFDKPIQVHQFDTMVNYGDFTPIDYSWDEKREWFWKQIVGLQPLHVIGENYGAYLLSKDSTLISKIVSAESQALDLS